MSLLLAYSVAEVVALTTAALQLNMYTTQLFQALQVRCCYFPLAYATVEQTQTYF
jgi:hypothetical protein